MRSHSQLEWRNFPHEQGCSTTHHKASFVSGQDEPNRGCEWLPGRARWSYLTSSGLPALSPKKNFHESHIMKSLYWPNLFGQDGWILASFFFARLWISTLFRSINAQKKNLANIQPSWPHTWSITLIYYMTSSVSGQDEPNRALWLATRAGKMEPSCPLETTRCIPQAKFPKAI